MKQRTLLPAGAAALALLAACGSPTGSTSTGEFPSDDMRIVVPYPAGGGVDISARAVAPCLEKTFKTTVIVENKVGGSGAVGTNEFLRARPDGHTLGMVLTSSAVVTPMSNKVGYALEDLTGIGQVAAFPYVVVVGKQSPYRTIDDLLAAGDGGRVKAAAPGAASQGDIELQLLKDAGLDVSIVPFDGTAGVKTAVLGNDVDFGVLVIDNDVLKQNEAGSLRILATTGEEREDYMPDVPAINETEQFSSLGTGTSYIGLVGSKEIPEKVRGKLEGALEDCLGESDVTSVVGADFVDEEFVDGKALMDSFRDQSDFYQSQLGE